MFKVLMQADLVDRNLVQDTDPADERESQREVYISCEDFIKIVEQCPPWSQPIFETLFLTGMRRGEALGLTWDNVNLNTRIITLSLGATKERRSKRVPMHKSLVQILADVRKERSSDHDVVFLNPDGSAPHEDSLTRCWRKAVKALGFNPKPTVHDLRHCWHTNSVRSGVHPAIADAILGHGDKKKSLQRLYLTISDNDLLREIDKMRFDRGTTEILVKK